MRAVLVLALVALPLTAAADVTFGGSRWQVARVAKTGSMPWAVTVAADGRALYVTHVGNKDRDNVRRYDTATLAVTARSRFPGHAVEAALSADNQTLYVSNSRRHTIVALDPETLTVRAQFATGRIPKDFRLTADGTHLYVADYGGATLTRIGVAAKARSALAVGRHPRGVGLSPDGATVYVTNMGSGTVSVVDARTWSVTATWRGCRAPRHVVTTAEHLLITCLGGREVVVLDRDSGRRLRAIPVGKGPKTLAVTHDGKLAFTADERSNSVTLIDLATFETATLRLPAREPCGIAVAPDDRTIYITARGSDELIVVDRS